MSRRLFSTFAAVAGGIALAGLAACVPDTPTELATDELSPSFAAHAERSALNQALATARAGTAGYHRLGAALDAEYVPISPCVALPTGEAAMGFHYGNPALIEDGGELDVARPEVLVYAPWRGGGLRLAAVEWIILGDDWTEPDPPEMLGHEFHFVEDEELWGLHAWIWQHNPDGMFADFNPRMSCDTED